MATHSSISCLEYSVDRGAWWATVYGVTKRRTRLSNRGQAPNMDWERHDKHQSGFSRETKPTGDIHLVHGVCFQELAHITMEAEKSHNL